MKIVIIACTASKLTVPAPPRRFYTGVTWGTWCKHGPDDGAMPHGWGCMALSAEHGLVHSWAPIRPYDRRLTRARLPELAELVRKQWQAFRHEDDEAAVIGGELYQELAVAADIPVAIRIDGRFPSGIVPGKRGGIGWLRQRVATFAGEVRGIVAATCGAKEADQAWAMARERWSP